MPPRARRNRRGGGGAANASRPRALPAATIPLLHWISGLTTQDTSDQGVLHVLKASAIAGGGIVLRRQVKFHIRAETNRNFSCDLPQANGSVRRVFGPALSTAWIDFHTFTDFDVVYAPPGAHPITWWYELRGEGGE